MAEAGVLPTSLSAQIDRMAQTVMMQNAPSPRLAGVSMTSRKRRLLRPIGMKPLPAKGGVRVKF